MSHVNPSKPGLRPLRASILAILCAGFGIAFLYWAASQGWYIYASRSWSTTQGTITESEYIDNGPRKDGEAHIRYLYTVDGHAYEGGNLLPGTLAYIDSDEEAKVLHYRPGMTVAVHYDPQDPQSSSLEVGVATRLTYIALVIGVFFISGALYIVWRLLRREPIRL